MFGKVVVAGVDVVVGGVALVRTGRPQRSRRRSSTSDVLARQVVPRQRERALEQQVRAGSTPPARDRRVRSARVASSRGRRSGGTGRGVADDRLVLLEPVERRRSRGSRSPPDRVVEPERRRLRSPRVDRQRLARRRCGPRTGRRVEHRRAVGEADRPVLGDGPARRRTQRDPQVVRRARRTTARRGSAPRPGRPAVSTTSASAELAPGPASIVGW